MRQFTNYFIFFTALGLSFLSFADTIDLETLEAANKKQATSRIVSEALNQQEKASQQIFISNNSQQEWVKKNLGAQFIGLFAKTMAPASRLQLTKSLGGADSNSLANKAFLNDPDSKYIESDETGWLVNRVNISTLAVIKNPLLDDENSQFRRGLELSNTLSRLSPESLGKIVDAPEEDADLNARLLNAEITTADYAKVESLTDALISLAKYYLAAGVLVVLAFFGFRKLKRYHEESKLEHVHFIDDEEPEQASSA